VRFTLKTLFVAVSAAALICCVFFALPGWLAVAILAFLWFLAPPVLIAGIVYGRGYARAFFIGCVSAGGCLPMVYLYVFAAIWAEWDWFDRADNETALTAKIAVAVFSFLVSLSGLAAMSVRWLFLRLYGKTGEHQASTPKEYSLLHGRVATIQMESTPIAPEPRHSSP